MGKNKSFRPTLKELVRRIMKYRLYVAISLALAVCSVILTVYLPILIGKAVDCIAERGGVMDKMLPILIKCALIAAICGIVQYIFNLLCNKTAYSVVRDIRSDAFAKIERLPLSYVDKHASGDLVSRIISDTDQLSDGLIMGFMQLFTGIFTIIMTLVFMLMINPLITLVVVLLTPLSLLVARATAKKTYDMFFRQAAVRGEQTAFLDEAINNQKTVAAYCGESKNIEKFGEMNERLRIYSQKATFYSSTVNPTTRFINSLVYTGVGLAGALAVVSNAMSVGMLASFLTYATQYAKPFNEITGVITELQNAFVCAARIFELIDEKTEPDDSENAGLGTVSGNVDFNNVSFSYSENQSLIKNLSLNVKQGSHIAIVGPTGCGKTTLINLLLRFYDVNCGGISVDNCDIRTVTRHSLRKNYGMVLQDTWIKGGTVRENIALGRPDATDEEIISAAKAAHSWGFISRLKDGLDTVLSEEGGGLSEGQKQLLCITRVMLCLPPILILDEATSSIDTRTEVRIRRAFSRLMRGKTTFIVAHRLSTVMDADLILVMKDGDIIEQGTHKELLSKGGFYKKLYESSLSLS